MMIFLCKYLEETLVLTVNSGDTMVSIVNKICCRWCMSRGSFRLCYSVPGHPKCILATDGDVMSMILVMKSFNMTCVDAHVDILEGDSIADPDLSRYLLMCNADAESVNDETDLLPSFCPREEKIMMITGWNKALSHVGQKFEGGAKDDFSQSLLLCIADAESVNDETDLLPNFCPCEDKVMMTTGWNKDISHVGQKFEGGVEDDLSHSLLLCNTDSESVNGETDLLPSFCPREDKVLMTLGWDKAVSHVGQKFEGGAKEFRMCLQKLSHGSCFEYIYLKNDPTRVTAVCAKKAELGCEWIAHAATERYNGFFNLQRFNNVHTCGSSSRTLSSKRVSSELVASLVHNEVRSKPSTRPVDVVRHLKEDYGLSVSYDNARAGVNKARTTIYGDVNDAIMVTSKLDNVSGEDVVLPPVQSRKKRILPQREDIRPMKCGRCGQVGHHNKKTCEEAILI